MSTKDLPVILFCDNQDAGKLSKNPVDHSKTKHIDIHYHVRQMCEEDLIEVQYLPTSQMTVDVMTKSLVSNLHLECLKGLGFKQCAE